MLFVQSGLTITRDTDNATQDLSNQQGLDILRCKEYSYAAG
jgi:hypothetical protein